MVISVVLKSSSWPTWFQTGGMSGDEVIYLIEVSLTLISLAVMILLGQK